MTDARYIVPVSGRAAFVLAHLLDAEDVARRLDARGIRGTPKAEAIREEILSAVALIRERGDAWHEAQRGESTEPGFTAPFVESDASARTRTSSDMSNLNAITQREAAAILGVSPQRVGQLRDDGLVFGWKNTKDRWEYDRGEVQMFADERAEDRSAA
jgi:hypothetical protein